MYLNRRRVHVITKPAIGIVMCLASWPAVAQDSPAAKPTAASRRDISASPLLSQYCFDCHGADLQEGNVRLDTLNLEHGSSMRLGETLDKVYSVVSRGKMPPEEAALPTSEERSRLVSWLERRREELAAELKPTLHRSRQRRLTVEEYNYTMQALFGVDADFSDMLPADPISSSGYRNASSRLGLSSLQMEAYLDSARRATQRYLQFGELDDGSWKYHIEFENLFYSTGARYKSRKHAPAPIDAATFRSLRSASRGSSPEYADPLGAKLPGAFSDDESMRAAIPKLNQQYVALPQRLPTGEMIVRVRAAGSRDANGRFPRMRVEAGVAQGDGCSINKRVLGEVDVTASLATPGVFEFRMRLEDVPTKGPLSEEDTFDRLSVFDMDQIFISNVTSDRRAVFALGRGGYSDPDKGSEETAKHLERMARDRVCLLYLDWIEIEMFPGVGDDNASYRWQISTVDQREQELSAAEAWIEQFMRAAYRRPVDASEVATKLALFGQLREQDYSWEASLRETLAAVLVSPSFLFLESNARAQVTGPRTVTPHQLASRLSYLLWLSPPDATLMQRANDGSLERPGVLRSEAKRLMAHPRSTRFIESFCRQWLRLDKYDNVPVAREHYPTFDADLATDSIRETLSYFHEVFASGSSALDLIDSDYAVLNHRLAEHYDVTAVTAGGLHRVELPEDSVRGGLLTQASLLTMNSDGVDSHPIRRGVWLLERLLNDPPPPPPPNVPQIEANDPDLQSLSLKQRIELHREPSACQACHEKIDPWGIPFENFDAIGRWREAEQRIGHENAQPVDSKTVLPDGERIDGISEFKRYLHEHYREPFSSALVHHMLTYSLGRPPDFIDRPHVDEIRRRFQASGYRLDELVVAIIDSPLFRDP